MKTILISTILLFAISAFSQEESPKPSKSKIELGLLQRLVEIKIDAEAKMTSIMQSEWYKSKITVDEETDWLSDEEFNDNDSTVKTEIDGTRPKAKRKLPSKHEANHKYIALKRCIDQLVIQAMGDMKRKNSIKLYKQLDKYYKGSRDAIPNIAYAKQLKQIDKLFSSLMRYPKTQKAQDPSKILGLTLGELSPVDAVSTINDIITGVRDFRAKKVDDVCTLLDGLRLVSLGELSKGDGESK
jgi:hypothetical protein